MTEEKKEKSELKQWKEGNTVTVAPTFSKFPMTKWIEWDTDCKNNYGDTRWIKAWSDHLNSMNDTKYKYLLESVLELKQNIEQLEIKINTNKNNSHKELKNIKGEMIN